ncbi:hypothetical protein LguiB_031681 [Lonicera macranthoides]
MSSWCSSSIDRIAYGLVATLALQLPGKDLPSGIGASYSYSLVSAPLLFSLLFTSLKIYGFQEIQKAVGLLCIASLVVVGLSTSDNTSQPFSIRAFWCSHCLEQKQMFGREAAKLLDYVECFPDGYRKGIKIAKACSDVGIEGFSYVLSGEQELSELAKASGFKFEDFSEQS